MARQNYPFLRSMVFKKFKLIIKLYLNLTSLSGITKSGWFYCAAFPPPCTSGNLSKLCKLTLKNRADELTGFQWQFFLSASCRCKSLHQVLSRKPKGWIHFSSLRLLCTTVVKMNAIVGKNCLQVMTVTILALSS